MHIIPIDLPERSGATTLAVSLAQGIASFDRNVMLVKPTQATAHWLSKAVRFRQEVQLVWFDRFIDRRGMNPPATIIVDDCGYYSLEQMAQILAVAEKIFVVFNSSVPCHLVLINNKYPIESIRDYFNKLD